jgi:hypothetical protein
MLRFAHFVNSIVRADIIRIIIPGISDLIIKEIISLLESVILSVMEINRIIAIAGLNVTNTFHYLLSFRKHTRKPLKAAATIAAEFK